VLASAGESPLKSSVTNFQLGEFVEPDNLEALASGMKKLCRQAEGAEETPDPDWDGYVAYASWDSNAAIILEAAKSVLDRR
jgi:hypothetical protein